MTTLAGKTVLLTGASRGIGVYIARALVAEQATVVGVSRSSAGLEQVSAEIAAVGGKFIGIPFDISQVQELSVLLEKVDQRVGSVDVLVNNAGIEIYQAFQNYTLEQLQSVIATNLLAAMELTRLLLPEMLARQSGHIVNIASLAAKKGHPYDSPYSASKAGLLMWGDALRQELRETGVQLSVICPGYVSDAGMLASTGLPAPALSGTSTPDRVANELVKAIQNNKAEVLVNQDFFTEAFTRVLLAAWQIFPGLGDRIYRWIGVVSLNQRRIH